MTLPLTYENYERLRESGIDPRSSEGRAVLETQVKFIVGDLVTVRSQSETMPDARLLKAIVEPRLETVRNMLYPLDSFASPILRAHGQFRPERLNATVNQKLKRDKQEADRYRARSQVIAAIALRQAMYTLCDDTIDPIQTIDEPIDLDTKVKSSYGRLWSTPRLAALYDANPDLLLDRTRETIAVRISRHYYALPVAGFSSRALARARTSTRSSEPEHQLAA